MSSDKSELALAIETLGVIPLTRYCQITGEAANAIHQRVHRGVWLVGREVHKPTGGDYWVDLAAVHYWVKKRTDEEIVALLERHVLANRKAS